MVKKDRPNEGNRDVTFHFRTMVTGIMAIVSASSLFTLSFVATPIKFLAKDVPIEHLLAVGRVTFRASAAVETLLLLLIFAFAKGWNRVIALFTGAVLTVQWVVIMPELDARTLARIAGEVLPASGLHALWIVADTIRIVLYASVAMKAGHSVLYPNDPGPVRKSARLQMISQEPSR